MDFYTAWNKRWWLFARSPGLRLRRINPVHELRWVNVIAVLPGLSVNCLVSDAELVRLCLSTKFLSTTLRFLKETSLFTSTISNQVHKSVGSVSVSEGGRGRLEEAAHFGWVESYYMIFWLKHAECITRMIELRLFVVVVHHHKNFLVNAWWCSSGKRPPDDPVYICGWSCD